MRAFLLAAAAALLLAACGAQAPPIPKVDAASFPPNAQAPVRQALAALEESPEDPAANARLGMLLHAHDRFEAALICYRRAARFAPQDPRWPYLEGTVLEASGDLHAAAEAWHESLEIAPAAPTFIHLGNAFDALGRPAESRRTFEDALQLNPDAPAALYGLGRLLAAAGNHEEAVEILRKAAALAPAAGAVHYALGVSLRDSGQPESARLALGLAERFQRAQPPIDDPVLDEVRALRRGPGWLLEAGRQLEAAGDVQQAAALYQEAVDQDPNFALAHSSLVGALGFLSRYEDAERHYRWALQVAPGLEELHYNWGIVEAERGALGDAALAFRAALEINPASADSRFNLGSVLAELGRERDAVLEFERALDLDPEHRLALFQLARRQIEAGNLDEGIAMLQRTLDVVDSKTPGLLYALADAYARKGDAKRAVLCAQKALELAVEFGDHQMAKALEQDLRGMGAIP